MMHLCRLFLALALSLPAAEGGKNPMSALQRTPNPLRRGTSAAVRVADGPLLFTGQVVAPDPTPDAQAQVEQALDRLAAVLDSGGASLSSVVRLNVYVTEDRVAPAVDRALAARFASSPPAVTLVRSPLTQAHALVALDAVAAVTRPSPLSAPIAGAAILPAGGKAFVSGQAEKGKDLGESVRLTMDSLHRSLAHLGMTKNDVVQIKAFIQPFAEHAAAVAQIEQSYAGGPVPPIVLVEWLSALPAEIELVAAMRAPPPTAKDPVAFLSLPGMTTSPLYCRVATVAAGTPLIFIAGLDSGAPTAREQWKDIFAQLGGVLFETGSSFRHLAKATYFLADADGRQPLGEIRPTYYDPVRPPAASALNVTSLGRPGRRVMLDMIAVPAR